MKHTPSTQRADDDAPKGAKGSDWFATFTLLDVSGAISSSQVRHLGAVILRLWRLMLQSLSDRSKSRVLGV